MVSKDTQGFVALLRERSMSHSTSKKVDVGKVVATPKQRKDKTLRLIDSCAYEI